MLYGTPILFKYTNTYKMAFRFVTSRSKMLVKVGLHPQIVQLSAVENTRWRTKLEKSYAVKKHDFRYFSVNINSDRRVFLRRDTLDLR